MSSKEEIEEITDPYKLREIGLTLAKKYFQFVEQPMLMFGQDQDPSEVWELTIACFRRLTTILPDFHFDWYQLGMLYQQEKLYPSAMECFEKALEIKPNYDKAYIGLGLTYNRKGEKEKAHECFWKAVVLNPKCCASWVFLGNKYEEKGDLDSAIACYLKAFVVNPGSFAGPSLQSALQEKQRKGSS